MSKTRKKQNNFLLIMAICATILFAAVIILSIPDPPPATESSSSQSSSQAVSTPEPEPDMPLSDAQLFTNSAFIGNSCVERLFVQGYALESDFLSGVGLTVNSAFDATPARLDKPVTELLSGEKKYTRIFVLFGINEVGNDPQQFITQYGVLIDHIKTSQPQAQIYVQSILPVTREKHQQNTYLVNNDNIRYFNGLIEQMSAQKQVYFLDIYQALVDSEGFLPDAASTDGVHLSKEYNQIWINYMKEQVK